MSEEKKMSEGKKIDLSGDGGVLKEIIKEGTGEETPLGACTVSLLYTGRMQDGTVFDASVDRNEPFEFNLVTGRVIRGFLIGIPTMKLGEICLITCGPGYAYGPTGSPPNIPPGSTLIFEVELLGWTGEDVSPNKDKSIVRYILEDGVNKISPSEGGSVKLHLKGIYEDRVFDDRELEFDYGEGSAYKVVEGVEMALEQMFIGETSRIEIHPKYAFGKNGSEEFDIPPNAHVQYVVKLIDCQSGFDEWKLSDEERLSQAKVYKEKGTKHFKTGHYDLAQKMYKKCIEIMTDKMKNTDEQKVLRVAAYCNIALCYQKTKEEFEAKQACNEVLKLDPHNIKAIYRRGQCNATINEFELALKDFQRVHEIDPLNKAAQNQIQICKFKIKESLNREKKIYANMFTKLGSNEKQQTNSNEPDVLEQCGEWNEEEAIREADRAFERDNNIVMI